MSLPARPLFLLTALLLMPWEAALAAPEPLFKSSSRRRAEAEGREETARRLAEAEARGALEKARLARESTAAQKQDLAAKARAALQAQAAPVLAAEQARQEEAAAKLQSTLENVSPEARERIESPVPVAVVVEDENQPPPPPMQMAQNTDAVSSAPAIPPPASPASPGAPKPQPLKPTPLENPAIKASRTIIDSTDSFFDANKSIGVFTGNVRVYSPRFYLECDELEVFMKKSNPDDKKPASPEDDEPPGGEEDEESNIEKIIARGAMVLIEKHTENGQDIQVGKCKHLTFDGATKIVTLRVWPQVQRGPHLQVSKDASTVMTISPKGELNTVGNHRTEILQGEAAKLKTKGLRRAPEP